MTALEIVQDSRPSAYMEDGTIILRASSLGSCTRDLVGLLLGHDPLPTPPDLQARFDAGSAAEPHILKRVEKLGWVFDEGRKQAEGELRLLPAGDGVPAVVVRFHPDGVAMLPNWKADYVVEAKALAPSTWKDAQRHGTGSLFGYDWQLSVMMHAYKLPGVWVALQKDVDADGVVTYEGELHIEYVTKAPRSLGELMKRAKYIRDCYLQGEMPECENYSQFPCVLLYLRPEKEQVERDLAEVVDEDEFEQLAAEYDVLTMVVATGTKADKDRKAVKERLLEIVGEKDGARARGWEVVKTVSDRPRMVASDERYDVTTITVNQDA